MMSGCSIFRLTLGESRSDGFLSGLTCPSQSNLGNMHVEPSFTTLLFIHPYVTFV